MKNIWNLHLDKYLGVSMPKSIIFLHAFKTNPVIWRIPVF